MSENRLWNVITGSGVSRPYGTAESCEAEGKVPAGSSVIKCTDTMFFVKSGQALYLYDEEAERVIRPEDCPEDTGLQDLATELSMAPEVILPAVFGAGSLTLGGETFDIDVRKAAEKLLLVRFPETDRAGRLPLPPVRRCGRPLPLRLYGSMNVI